jgi:hypothetical protein
MSSRVPQLSTKRLDENYRNEGKPVEADITSKQGRTQKQTDILIFDRIGVTRKTNEQGPVEGMIFRGANHKALAGLIGRKKADDQDVFNIFRTAGMTAEQASDALQSVKDKSTNLGLAGLSASAVGDQLNAMRTWHIDT